MPQSTTNELGGRIGLRVPSNISTAYEQVANELDYEAGAHESVRKSDLIREALRHHLRRLDEQGKLPEETRDLLDDDLIADAGGDAGVLEEVDA